MKRIYKIDSEQDKREIAQRIADAPFTKPFTIAASFEDDRTAEQNKKMWAILRDVSKHVNWHGQKLDAESWKHIFSASLYGQKAVIGLDGGLVMMGKSTSRMSKAMFSEFIEMVYAFGNENEVPWGNEAEQVFEDVASCDNQK